MFFHFRGLPISPFVPRVPVVTNIATESNPAYTKEDFQGDFPQFTEEICEKIPLESLITLASGMLTYDKWRDKWRYAMGLATAHFAILQLSAGQNPAGTIEGLISAGKSTGIAASKSVGDVSVSYDLGANDSLKEWGSFTNTVYGQQLITLARIVGVGGSFLW